MRKERALLIAALLVAAPLPAAARPEGATAQKAPRKRPPKHPRHGAAAPGPAPAGPAPAPGAAEAPAREPVAPPLALERFTLDNGLRVVLAPVRKAPSVAVTIVYDAGSRLEERGGAGLASLMQRAMTLGSANLLRGEHERHLSARGGRASSEVTSERAAFWSTLPVAELPLGLWLEADRLKSLQLPADSVSSLRDAMAGEMQRAIDPVESARARVRSLVFQAAWPYEHDPRGVSAEISSLKPEAVQAFYEAHYGASNAVLVVAGDIETESTGQLVRRFFETARRQERPAAPSVSLPEQTSQRASTVESAQARAPRLFYGWATPTGRTEDAAAVDAALFILAQLRLPLRLQHERGLASRVAQAHEDQRLSGLARLEVDLTDAAARAEAERWVDAELDALAQKGPTDGEVRRYRAAVEAQAWRASQSPEDLAQRLADYELIHGDARLLTGELSLATALGREKVRAAAARYLSASRRSLVVLAAPGSETAAPSAPAPPGPALAPAPVAPGGHRGKHGKPPRPRRK